MIGMSTLTVTFKPDLRSARVDIDADRFERLASVLGFFNPDFLASVDRSEREIAAGKARPLRSLRSLRRTP